MRNLTIFLVLLLLCCACATPEQTTGLVASGVAGFAAIFNELAAAKVISPVQHTQMLHGLDAIQATVTAATETARAAQKVAEQVKAGTWSSGEIQAGLGTAAGATALAVNTWRNLTRAKDIKEAVKTG